MAASPAEEKSKPATCQPQPSEPVTGHPPVTGYPPMQASYAAGNPPVYPGHHPYTAPPPATYYNPSQPYPSPYYNFRKSGFCRGFLITLIALILISVVISFFTWIVLRPQVPTFRIESFAVSNFNLSLPNSVLTANWDVGISTRNPNKKMNVFYDRLETYLLYGESDLGMTLLHPIYMRKEEQKTVHDKLVMVSENLNELVAKEMAGDRSSGSVSFSVRMIVWARFTAGDWFTRRRWLRVFCENMKVVFLNNATRSGKFMDAPMACTVSL